MESLESVWLSALSAKASDQAAASTDLVASLHGKVSSLSNSIGDFDSLEMRLVKALVDIWLRETSRYSSFSAPGILGLVR